MSGGEAARLPEPKPAVSAAAGASQAGGTLILVVGPSGAGKDTLLDAARAHFQDAPGILFWERIITREDQTGEKHTSVSEVDFARLESSGEFFLCWEAHGLHYGIDGEALDALAGGRTVIVNVSRRVIGEARAKWPKTRVIHVTARPDVLERRLLARGRETLDGIGGRLERAKEICLPQAEWVQEVDNSGDLETGIAQFTALIAELADSSTLAS
jgi:ribose 1,5-bisphosphokinase